MIRSCLGFARQCQSIGNRQQRDFHEIGLKRLFKIDDANLIWSSHSRFVQNTCIGVSRAGRGLAQSLYDAIYCDLTRSRTKELCKKYILLFSLRIIKHQVNHYSLLHYNNC